MKKIVRFVVSLLIVSLVMSLAACSPGGIVVPSETPKPTPTVVPTPTPTPTPSPTPTAIPTPVVDEYGFTEERKAELNQQFQDFLNKQGEFTPEKMSQIMMETMSNLDKSEVGLGIATDLPEIQGYFFDYLEKDNRIFLFVGFDGKDGKRFITPLEIPLYFYEIYKPAQFGVVKYKENDIGTDVENRDGEDLSDNKGKLTLLLDSLKGRVVVFNIELVKIDESAGDGLNSTIRADVISYINEVNSKVVLSFGLIQLLSQNKITLYEWPSKIIADSESIIKIIDPAELGKINIDQVPLIGGGISFYSGEFPDAG